MKVYFTAPADLAPAPDETPWVAVMPSRIPHGDAYENDSHKGFWRYLDHQTSGMLTLTSPAEPGSYDVRMHDSGWGNEVAYVSFQVVEAGGSQNAPPLTGAYLRLRGEPKFSWATEDPSFHRPYVSIDAKGGRIVFRPSPDNVADGGEMELHWSPPPARIDSQGIDWTWGGKVTVAPRSGSSGASIRFRYSDFFAGTEPPGTPTEQWVGRGSDDVLYQGDYTVHLQPKLADRPNEPTTWITVTVNWLSITYEYDVIR